MDVGGALLYGVGQDEIDQLDHRGVFGGSIQLRQVNFSVIPFWRRLFLLLEVPDQGPGKAGRVVVSIEGISDRGLWGHHRLDVVARHESDVIDGNDVGRVRHGDREDASGSAQWDQQMFIGEVSGNKLDDSGGDLDVGKVCRRGAPLVGGGGG